PLKILMLHGYTQNPTLFRAKTRALEKALHKPFPAAHLAYVPAPHRLARADIPGYNTTTSNKVPSGKIVDEKGEEEEEEEEALGWWRRKDYDIMADGVGKEVRTEVVYSGIEVGLAVVAECIRAEGPFDGVIGFSQGAALAAMVASLLQGRVRKEALDEAAEQDGGMPYPSSFLGDVDGFVQGPLKFAVCYSGFRAPGRLYGGFYEPGIGARVLCVLGQVDGVVDEGRGRALVGVCEGGGGRVVVHPGGHFVPCQKMWLDAVVGFVRECVEGKGKEVAEVEEKVEDMDVPF
ncbi:serine hydrolase FSH, partial [Usnea florida]